MHKGKSSSENLPVAAELIVRRIHMIRGHKVMLDRDLAELYGVKPIALRQQVRRNRQRFPQDFMFALTLAEAELLVSQNVIPSRRSFGGSLPYVFTQEGVAMLSSVLTSQRAVQVNIAIMRAFARLRQLVRTHKDLAAKIAAMEKKYDGQFRIVFQAIKRLLEPPLQPRRRIGFHVPNEK
ncbi:MAG TPA: ORF6N domain-containing protein [Bryobacteraceae bacterium]|nr:ORF6N domain-containing protein [Bryobacteraceae bacterium]